MVDATHVISRNQSKSSIYTAYALLMLCRTGPAGGLLDAYAIACKRIVYVLYIFSAYAKLIFIVVRILILLINLELAFII